jgi:hypothetical protein
MEIEMNCAEDDQEPDRTGDAVYQFVNNNLREPRAMLTAAEVARLVVQIAIPVAAASIIETTLAVNELRARVEALEARLKVLLN